MYEMYKGTSILQYIYKNIKILKIRSNLGVAISTEQS